MGLAMEYLFPYDLLMKKLFIIRKRSKSGKGKRSKARIGQYRKGQVNYYYL